jgi:tryptophanyl-tRNA synthetase
MKLAFLPESPRLMLSRCLARTKAQPHCRLYSILSSGTQHPIIFSGIQPTGTPHLGNYLGAMKNWANLQAELPESATIIYSIVDLHAITVPYDRESLGRNREEMWRVLYAVGIDMDRCVVFEQSAVRPFRTKLMSRSLNTLNCIGFCRL